MPLLGILKYTSKPPQWFLDVNTDRIELNQNNYTVHLCLLACLDQANLVVPVPKAKDWKQYYLKPLLQNVQR